MALFNLDDPTTRSGDPFRSPVIPRARPTNPYAPVPTPTPTGPQPFDVPPVFKPTAVPGGGSGGGGDATGLPPATPPPPPPGVPTSTTTPNAPPVTGAGGSPPFDPTGKGYGVYQVYKAYQDYLGRVPSADEMLQWSPNLDIDSTYAAKIIDAIRNSEEAQAYAKKHGAGTGTGTGTTPAAGAGAGNILDVLNAAGAPGTDAFNAALKDYFTKKGIYGQAIGNGYTYGQFDPTRNKVYDTGGYDYRYENGQWVAHPNGESGAGSGTQVFSDPATAEWEQLLRQVVGQLQTPYQPQDWTTFLNYLRDYATKLQQPGYTPQQQDIIRTSVNEPIMQARDAALQRLRDNLAGRNIGPSSGIAQDEQNQIGRFYDAQRTLADRGFATNAINLDRADAAQAAAVLGQLTGSETGLAQGNEQRVLQSLGLMGQIPQLADQRLQLALQTMNPNNINPLAALQTLLQQGNINSAQSNQFWLALGQALATLFGGH